LLLILVIVFFVYGRSLDNAFIFDDRGLTVDSTLVTDPSIENIFSSYRPVRTASYALDHFVFGSSPVAFRGMNIFYHLLVGVLVFLFVRSISGGYIAPLIAATLFALHPIQTDAVAYISGRRDILVALFFVASLVAFLRYVRSGGPGYLALSLFAFILSFLSKETGAMVPLVMLAMLFSFGRVMPPARKRMLLAVFLLLLSGALVMALRGGGSPLIYRGNITFHGNSAVTHYLTAATLLPYYIKQAIFPLQLIMDNANYPLVTDLGAKFFFSLLAILFYLAIMVRLYVKKHVRLSFYMLFFLATLLPVLQIVPLHEIAADHYLYLPLVGFCGIVGELGGRAVAWLQERRRIVPAVAFLTLLCLTLPLYSAKTTQRIGEMSDIYTVLLADHQWRPISFRGLYTIGAFYMDAGFPDIAYRYYRASLATGYYDASLLGNILSYYIVKGDHAAAIRYFEEREHRKEAVSSPAFAHMAVIYAIQGDCPRAEATIQRLPAGVFEQQRALVAQCADLAGKNAEDKIDMLRSLGLFVEARPLYEHLLYNDDTHPEEIKKDRLRELIDILARHDVLFAFLIVKLSSEASTAGQRAALSISRERGRLFCVWSDAVLRNGFCREPFVTDVE